MIAISRVAVLTADLFEDVELWYPYYRLLEEGHRVDLVGCETDKAHAGKRGTTAVTTAAASEIDAAEIDAVVVPGGYSPDHMRRCPAMVELVRQVGLSGKPTAAICHGPWMLASVGLLRGREATSFHSIKDDVVNAANVHGRSTNGMTRKWCATRTSSPPARPTIFPRS